MENYKLVMPEHLNHYGYLFGGKLLKWVDEYAWIAASIDFPGCQFVTVGMDRVEFKKTVSNGSILKFAIELAKEGNTSVQYKVAVLNKKGVAGKVEEIFSTTVTMVNIDKNRKKAPLRRKTIK